ncbi:MAG: phospho-N-acetylmuramoyl-pentapeptide-transferase [Flavobacteriales bacterium TMED84]|nr:MAG: phospho-N-acetylmuramoyl-pentapeptide-transferase [Flavobacteriales bacterium TMED84]|tara:strand:- start:200 stop:1423 length:1224 start_codon:yes stop_codon:yes gene_type:complete
MLYHLFEFLQNEYNLVGASIFKYISFRASAAVLLSLLFSIVFGKRIIRSISNYQIKENVRKLGLKDEENKEGTPTMGGIIIILSILIPTLLLCNLTNIYVQIMLLTTVWLGGIGFIDDYIKVFKKNKAGLSGKFKIFGQVALALIVGLVIVFNNDITIKEKQRVKIDDQNKTIVVFSETPKKSSKTTIPFFKNNEFDYKSLTSWIGNEFENYAWVLFVLIVIFIVTAVSNGANMTDGLDGLATGVSSIIGITLAVFGYVSGNIIAADYLNIMYIPNSGEIVIFLSAFVASCVGFLWHNSYPADIFMGDTGSLTIGGIIAVSAILIRKELLIPIFCGVFLIQNLSVIIQVAYFKYTKKKTGVGKRVFLMSPIHHHFQKKGIHENKIVLRFWIIALLFAVISILTLKIR